MPPSIQDPNQVDPNVGPIVTGGPGLPPATALPPAPLVGAAPMPLPAGSAPQIVNAGRPQKNPNSSQNSLLISELRDGVAIMNDGSMRALVACRSINFDLMSDREREAVEYSYQQFLNSLYFPIQIFIRSQKVDLGPYLERLSKIRRDQDNMLLGVLMDDYIDFINMLAQETNIMDKGFFIVVPYFPAGDVSSAVNSSKNFFSALFAPQTQQRIRIDEKTYTKGTDELKNRVSTVVNGLMQLGIRATRLDTKRLGELYYNIYNPDTAVREPLGNFEDLSAPIVEKGTGQAPQPHLDKEIL